MDNQQLDAARAHLNTALREEGEALTSACDAVNAGGAKSDQAIQALRSAQAAHARSNIAASELRAALPDGDRAAGPLATADVRGA